MNFRQRYQLIKKLGEGGFGQVHLALDLYDNRKQVALKLLMAPDDLDGLRRFAREARTLWEQMANKHVVNFIAAQLDEPEPYMVMEFCSEGSLRSWVNQRKPWRDCAWILVHVVRGLMGLHIRGGFHRDLKPENILLTRGDNGKLIAKIADFGLARVPRPGSSMTNTAAGTYGYIAPEVLQGLPFDARADIYSLGVVALELLTGGRRVGALQLPLHVEQLPAGLRDLMAKMVSSDPARRPTADQIARALEAMLTTTTTSKPGGSSFWGDLLKLAGVVLGTAAAVSLVDGSNKSWDPEVQRYRGPDGRFKSG